MGKMRRRIPQFSSEEAQFWATHDTVDYWEETEGMPDEAIEIDPGFRAAVLERARMKQLISLRLEKRQITLAKKLARQKSVGYQTLMRTWIEEGMQRELAKEPEQAQADLAFYSPWVCRQGKLTFNNEEEQPELLEASLQ